MYRFLVSLLGLVAGTTYAAPVPEVSSMNAVRNGPPPGCLTVGLAGQHHTVGAALSALGSSPSPACIYIAQGTYKEKVVINYKGALTLYGETSDISSYKGNAVTITHTISSDDAGTLDDSATLQVKSNDFKMYNINVVNGYGPGKQALA